jgi:hypothetical protein
MKKYFFNLTMLLILALGGCANRGANNGYTCYVKSHGYDCPIHPLKQGAACTCWVRGSVKNKTIPLTGVVIK